jgi:hypothetical protein
LKVRLRVSKKGVKGGFQVGSVPFERLQKAGSFRRRNWCFDEATGFLVLDSTP